mmetsp:Transcript_16429/g.53490  ORF Transcript_16429/g.53490 Transcript_16429/m.53490 type:complete len:251 (-) Transcript_16429:313-1065(-)
MVVIDRSIPPTLSFWRSGLLPFFCGARHTHGGESSLTDPSYFTTSQEFEGVGDLSEDEFLGRCKGGLGAEDGEGIELGPASFGDDGEVVEDVSRGELDGEVELVVSVPSFLGVEQSGGLSGGRWSDGEVEESSRRRRRIAEGLPEGEAREDLALHHGDVLPASPEGHEGGGGFFFLRTGKLPPATAVSKGRRLGRRARARGRGIPGVPRRRRSAGGRGRRSRSRALKCAPGPARPRAAPTSCRGNLRQGQ